MMKKNLGFKEEEKRVKYYSSRHQILLVGEGDFSFSLCLGRGFGSASNIVASSLDSYDDVVKKYKEAKSNLDKLNELGACLLYGVDATKMKLHPHLKRCRFDRVIFNFPHAGFHGNEDNRLVIMKHKNLVRGFFANARCLLQADGEIHINHKSTSPFSKWRIDELASENYLTLIEIVDFKKEDYPGYNHKRGDGPRCDQSFPLGKSSTYKFVHNHKAMESPVRSYNACTTNLPSQEIEPVKKQMPTSFHLYNEYPQINHTSRMNEALPGIGSRKENSIIGGYSEYVADGLRRATPDAGLLAPRRPDLQRPFQPLPPPNNFRYMPTDHVGKTDMLPLSPGAINEPYHVFGCSSSYLGEELGRRGRTLYEMPGGTLNHVELHESLLIRILRMAIRILRLRIVRFAILISIFYAIQRTLFGRKP